MLLGIFLISWYIFGVLSFIYWWTSEFDFKNDDIPKALMVGFFGLFSFFMGWSIHGKSKVIIKRR